MNKDKEFWIKELNLSPHPEGGWYKECYRSQDFLNVTGLPGRYQGNRNASTSIYFLLDSSNPSKFHRLQSDEIWHFYIGSPLRIWMIGPSGELREQLLGPDPTSHQSFQFTIPHGTWFAAEIADKSGYALIGCTVAPGFDFTDFELADKVELQNHFPQHAQLIERLT